MKNDPSAILIQGLTGSFLHEYQLFYKTTENHGLDRFFYNFCQRQQLKFEKDRYDSCYRNLASFEVEYPLAKDKSIKFTMSPSKDHRSEKKIDIDFFRNRSDKKFCLLSMHALFDENKPDTMDCNLWMLDRNLPAVREISSELLNVNKDIVQLHAGVIKELAQFCSAATFNLI